MLSKTGWLSKTLLTGIANKHFHLERSRGRMHLESSLFLLALAWGASSIMQANKT